MDPKTGVTYDVVLPSGMPKTDFAKCLKMARRYGRYDVAAGKWSIFVTGPQVAACIAEMADRGARVQEAQD